MCISQLFKDIEYKLTYLILYIENSEGRVGGKKGRWQSTRSNYRTNRKMMNDTLQNTINLKLKHDTSWTYDISQVNYPGAINYFKWNLKYSVYFAVNYRTAHKSCEKI